MTARITMKSAERRTVANSKNPNGSRAEIVSADGQLVTVPASAWTLDGFRQWALSPAFPQRGRISFINGELIIDMSPEEYNNHNQVKSEVGFTAFRLNKKLDLGKFASDRTLVTNVAADLSTEPDAGLVRWQTLRKGRLLMIPRADERGDFMEWKGSPDWLLEIISKYSERKDTKLLREQYYKAEVSEYWLINARGRRIDFQILIWKPEGYVSAGTRAGWQFSPLFQHWFKLERKKDRIGLWEYTMHTKAK